METKETKLFEGLKQLSEKGEGTARIATLDTRDKDGDVLRAGCCGEQHVPLLIAHQWDRVPVGKVRVYESPGAMLADFKVNMGLGRGKELYSALRFDLDNPPPRAEWSFGFRIPEGGSERGMFQGQPVRFLKRLELLEVSPVVAGAGVATATLALKEHQDQAAVVARVQETLRRGEQFLAKLAVQEFEQVCGRFKESIEHPHAYTFLAKGALPDFERGARNFASWAAEDLGIPTPELKLFRVTRGGESPDFRMACKAIGVYFGFPDHTIAVDGSLGPEALAETVAHECMHAAGGDESAAEAFARKFVTGTYRKMVGGGGPRAGYPMPGMKYDQTPVVVSYQPIS